MDLNVFGQGLGNVKLKPLEPKKKHYTKESLESLNHPFLESLPLFQDLLSELKAFYAEKSTNKWKATRWKSVLYNSLHNLINELIYTEDRSLQLKLLEQVSQWYNSKITPVKPTAAPITSRTDSSENHPVTPMGAILRSSMNTPIIHKKSCTPQPSDTNMMKTSYQAFATINKSYDGEIDAKLQSIFEAMQQRQKKRLGVGRYNESKR